MRNRKLLIATAVLTGTLSSGFAAQADMASSVVLANTCFSCHGTDGKSVGAMPSIHGKPAKMIEMNLKAFRDGKKESTVMMRIAKGFTDEEIKSLAEYFAKNQN